MMSPEFRTKLEDILRDWYAAQDAGEMTMFDLINAVANIAKNHNPKQPEMSGAMAGMLGAMAGSTYLMKPMAGQTGVNDEGA